ncbi:MAG: transporter substrate-binding domain-containing protein [Alphaproteobacteria bacterium]|nr:transporter substrate-binding domain-containing protein [Alphaproteobacteria bacterium]
MKKIGGAGWTYEYVEGNWSNLFQMLIDGKIDLLSDVSYTEERSKQMLFFYTFFYLFGVTSIVTLHCNTN